jgi:rhodanese-related sulfurtransferase
VKERMDRGEPLVFLDTRAPEAWDKSDVKIAGAIRVPPDKVEQHLKEIPRDHTIITYCTCPHEASSARVALSLMIHDWKNVHPLYGGFEAWRQAGSPVESK